MQIVRYMNTFWYLLLADLKVFRQGMRGQIIDMLIWASTISLVFTYLMPAFGLAQTYGSFMIASLCASGALFNVFPSVMWLINDFDGDRIVGYYLTLPIPSWMVFLKSIVYYAISGMTISAVLLPWNKLIVGKAFDLSNFNLVKYLLIFAVGNIFYAAFTLFLATCVPDVTKIGRIWMRILYPLWFMGGFQFSWDVLYKHVPWFASVSLANPFVYLMEGTRAAILGDIGSIPFWTSLLVLFGFCIGLTIIALMRIKRRLDFV